MAMRLESASTAHDRIAIFYTLQMADRLLGWATEAIEQGDARKATRWLAYAQDEIHMLMGQIGREIPNGNLE